MVLPQNKFLQRFTFKVSLTSIDRQQVAQIFLFSVHFQQHNFDLSLRPSVYSYWDGALWEDVRRHDRCCSTSFFPEQGHVSPRVVSSPQRPCLCFSTDLSSSLVSSKDWTFCSNPPLTKSHPFTRLGSGAPRSFLLRSSWDDQRPGRSWRLSRATWRWRM